jgi:prolyl-tRNA synthetase
VSANACVLASRHLPGKEGKQFGVPLEAAALGARLRAELDAVQAGLLAQAVAFRDSRIVDVASMAELRSVVEDGRWARAGWAGSDADEARVKEETGATFRCYPFQQPAGGRPCVVTGKPGAEVAIFAKAY